MSCRKSYETALGVFRIETLHKQRKCEKIFFFFRLIWKHMRNRILYSFEGLTSFTHVYTVHWFVYFSISGESFSKSAFFFSFFTFCLWGRKKKRKLFFGGFLLFTQKKTHPHFILVFFVAKDKFGFMEREFTEQSLLKDAWNKYAFIQIFSSWRNNKTNLLLLIIIKVLLLNKLMFRITPFVKFYMRT